MERTEITRYLASLTDDEFTQLTADARQSGAGESDGLKRGQELYRNNGRRTIEVDRAHEHIAWESK